MPYFRDVLRDANFNDRAAVFIAFMLGISMPLRASGVAAQQAAMGLALVAVFAVLAISPTARGLVRQGFFSRLGVAVALVFVAWGIGLFFSFDPYASLKVYARTGAFVVAAVLIWAALSTHPEVHGFMWKALIVSSIVFAVLALLSINGIPYILSIFKGRILDHEVPSQAFKAFAATVMCLIPMIVWAGRKLNGPWQWAGYAFVPMAILIMIQTFNRAALAGVLVMAVLLAIRALTMRNKYVVPILLLTVSFVVVAMSWVIYKEVENAKYMGVVSMANLGHLYLPEWLIDSHRQYIWKFAFERFLEHPWLGNGIDQINKLPNAELRIPYMDGTAPWVPSHPHNWAVEVLAETGVVGFTFMVAALGLITFSLLRRYQLHQDEGMFALIVFMAGFWLSALFNFSFWATWWQLTFVVIYAMFMSAYNPKSSAG